MPYISPVLAHYAAIPQERRDADGQFFDPVTKQDVSDALHNVHNFSPIGTRSLVAAPRQALGEMYYLASFATSGAGAGQEPIDAGGLWEAIVLLQVIRNEPGTAWDKRNALNRTVERLADPWATSFSWRVYAHLAALGVQRLLAARQLELHPRDETLQWYARKVQHAIVRLGAKGGVFGADKYVLKAQWGGSEAGNAMYKAWDRAGDYIVIGNHLLSEESDRRRGQGYPVRCPEMDRERAGCLPGTCSIL